MHASWHTLAMPALSVHRLWVPIRSHLPSFLFHTLLLLLFSDPLTGIAQDMQRLTLPFACHDAVLQVSFVCVTQCLLFRPAWVTVIPKYKMMSACLPWCLASICTFEDCPYIGVQIVFASWYKMVFLCFCPLQYQHLCFDLCELCLNLRAAYCQ